MTVEGFRDVRMRWGSQRFDATRHLKSHPVMKAFCIIHFYIFRLLPYYLITAA
jgi:hypothetical protein